MRQRAVSAREVLTRHPWAIGLMDSRRSPGPATLQHHDAVIAEGDKVATRWTASMTRDHRRVTMKGITIDRFEDGKIVEAWRSMDMLGLLQQDSVRERED